METIQPPQLARVHAAGPKQSDGAARDKAVAQFSPGLILWLAFCAMPFAAALVSGLGQL